MNTLNGVSSYWDTAAMNGTYWHIKVLPDRDFHLGNVTHFHLSEASKVVYSFDDQSK